MIGRDGGRGGHHTPDPGPRGAPLQDCCTEWILKVRIDLVVHLVRTASQNRFSRWGQPMWSTFSGLLHRTDSQGEDRPGGAPLQDCCTEWILKVRAAHVEHLFSTAAQNGFSRWGQSRWSTSSGLLLRMDSQGEDIAGGATLQNCCTEWIF